MYSGREGVESSTIGLRSSSRDCKVIIGRSFKFSGRTLALLTWICWSTSAILCSVSCNNARFTTRTCWVRKKIYFQSSFFFFKYYFIILHITVQLSLYSYPTLWWSEWVMLNNYWMLCHIWHVKVFRTSL